MDIDHGHQKHGRSGVSLAAGDACAPPRLGSDTATERHTQKQGGREAPLPQPPGLHCTESKLKLTVVHSLYGAWASVAHRTHLLPPSPPSCLTSYSGLLVFPGHSKASHSQTWVFIQSGSLLPLVSTWLIPSLSLRPCFNITSPGRLC